MPVTKRQRTLSLGSGTGRQETRRGGALISASTGAAAVAGTQITESEGHPFHHKWEGRDEGGDFFTTIQKVDGIDPTRNGRITFRNYYLDSPPGPTGTYNTYHGPVFPFNPTTLSARLSQVGDDASDDATLIALGTEAISKVKPGQPIVNLSTSLAELLREGMPKLVGHSMWAERARAAGRAKSSSGEYLNWVFGWQPLISDIKGVAKVLTEADALMKQYERDSGRIVRRHYDFPEERSESTTLIQENVNPSGTHLGALKAGMWINGDISAQGRLYKTTTVVKKRSFSGAFTYYLPDSWYSRDRMKRAATRASVLLGIELTPEVVWNLTPWSWAADWFLNTGHVLSNVSDFAIDDLVLHYGYVMEHTVTTDHYQLKDHTLRGVPSVLEMSFSRETKRRLKATPFGFGLTWDSFSPRQLSIIAALGINRVL